MEPSQAALPEIIDIAWSQRLRDLLRARDPGGALDLSAVRRIDTAAAWVMVEAERRPGGPALTGAIPQVERTLDLVRAVKTEDENAQERRMPDPSVAIRSAADALAFFGRILTMAAALIRRPSGLRLTPTVHHLRETGLSALPIVSLMAFLIGVVLAFQGAAQLSQFGAEIFVVDLIAVSVLRELGVLLTAIIVAGRSGAAFTAALGAMKIREEVDALRTLALDPVAVLALPRIVALVVALPLLTVAANLSGLAGGLLMSWIELGVSPASFLARAETAISVNHLVIGLVKAPFFALIIGLAGCWYGLRVDRDAEVLGRLTSRAVVVSIFLVIMADATFSILFALIDL